MCPFLSACHTHNALDRRVLFTVMWATVLRIKTYSMRRLFMFICLRSQLVIWEILEANGFLDKITNLIMYDNCTCRILHQGKVSNRMPVKAGIKPAWALSPILFLLAIDTVMYAVNSEPRGLQWSQSLIKANISMYAGQFSKIFTL